MKAILIVNMPTCCTYCDLRSTHSHTCYASIASETNKCDVDDYVLQEEKPSWCPLKPLPNKKKPNDPDETWEELHHRFGYNDCIDEILGVQDADS